MVNTEPLGTRCGGREHLGGPSQGGPLRNQLCDGFRIKRSILVGRGPRKRGRGREMRGTDKDRKRARRGAGDWIGTCQRERVDGWREG